ncbi:hypothetical protein L917_12468 [Phytophthora nicotianae]|uniref:Uncharacterized protein n=1 Tax=Phytophthora nicotianae TaxID=4792 RepID=W2INW8_PHYNI|nr:hypothetical protein L916_12629 [Phytophthora nicotianae]ETL88453.1 hypothetical protein L917_12468 [Phytophthora nicotianae]
MAIFIVSQQQQEHHSEVLAMLREIYVAVTGKPLRVHHYVMGDADAAQWNAVHEVFSPDNDIVFLMCYFM